MNEAAPAPDIQAQAEAPSWSPEAFLSEVERTGARLAVSSEGLTYSKGDHVRVPHWIEAELLADPRRIEALVGLVSERQRQQLEQERQQRITATLDDALAQAAYGSPGSGDRGPGLPWQPDQVEREVAKRSKAVDAEIKRRKAKAK